MKLIKKTTRGALKNETDGIVHPQIDGFLHLAPALLGSLPSFVDIRVLVYL
jgi:hypothetical protein